MGDSEVAGIGAWVDEPGDAAWSHPQQADVLRSIDRFHPVPANDDTVVASGFSTAEASAKAVRRTVDSSLESSRRALKRDGIDILQIPNATLEMIEAEAITDALLDAKERGLVRALGATVYEESAALSVIRSGKFDVLQIAFDILDQLVDHEGSGVGIVCCLPYDG